MKALVLLFIFSLSANLAFANANKAGDQMSLEKMLEQFMQDREKMIEQFMNDDFSKQIQKMMQDLDNDTFFNNNGTLNMGQGFGGGTLKYRSEETKNDKRIILEDIDSKNNPIDLKIKNGAIIVKGEIKKKITNQGAHGSSTSVSISSFNQSIPVPVGVDVAGFRVEQNEKKKELVLIFPLAGTNVKAKVKKVLPKVTPTPDTGRRPIRSGSTEGAI